MFFKEQFELILLARVFFRSLGELKVDSIEVFLILRPWIMTLSPTISIWHRHYISTTKPGCIHRETPQRCTERPNSWLHGSSKCSFCNLTGWLSQNHAPGVKDTAACASKNLQAIHFFSCFTCINNVWDVWLGVRCFESSYDHMLEKWQQTTYLNKWLWWCCKHLVNYSEMVHCLLLCTKALENMRGTSFMPFETSQLCT